MIFLKGCYNPHFSPGFGILGQAGEAGWTIGRRTIAVAMGKTDQGKGPENLFPVERIAQGWATLDKQAEKGERR